MNRAIAVTRPQDWAMIQEIAPVAATAHMFGVTKEQAAIVMLKGRELGLGLAASFEFIHVIDSKPSISPKGCLALIHSSGELKALEIKDLTDPKGNPTRCRVTMERVNGFKYTVTYTMDDAKRANLVKPGSAWEKYPANMLRWRAVGYCADVVFPDVIGGMLRPEELGAEVGEGGEPVWSEVTTTIPHISTSPVKSVTVTGAVGEPVVYTAKPLPVEPTGTSPDVATIPVPDTTGWGSGVAAKPTSAERADVEAYEAGSRPGDTNQLTTIDALIAAGYSAEQIVAANEGRVPSTAADCIRVAKILKEQ